MIREALWSAVWRAVSGLALPDGSAAFATASRRLVMWSAVDLAAMPALYMTQGEETVDRKTGQPSRHHLHGKLWVYVGTDDPSKSPSEILNPLLDIICWALKPDANTLSGRCTLGISGVVDIRIEGQIQTFEGTLGDKEVAIVPIVIIAAEAAGDTQ